MEWQPISSAPKLSMKMFVVAAFNVKEHRGYNSDPYCVWRDSKGNFVRWPHKFSPTHWLQLPEKPEEL